MIMKKKYVHMHLCIIRKITTNIWNKWDQKNNKQYAYQNSRIQKCYSKHEIQVRNFFAGYVQVFSIYKSMYK